MLCGIHPYWNFHHIVIYNYQWNNNKHRNAIDNFIHCSHQEVPQLFSVPKVIHPSATRYPRERQFLRIVKMSILSEGVDPRFHACAKVCLNFLKFTKLPNFGRDKYVSVKSNCKGTELFCVANVSAESSFWSSAPVVSLASDMLIMLTYCVLKYATTADTQCMENVGS